MAEVLDDGEFWLPSSFLSDDDMFVGKDNFAGKNGGSGDVGLGLSLPSEFSYGFGSFGFSSSSSSSALSSPGESVVGSTETESDEEDFLAGLTRKLAESTLLEAKNNSPLSFNRETWLAAGSPDSKSSTKQSSPPATPFVGKNDPWELIYMAAGHVARMKANQVVRNTVGLHRNPNISPVPVASKKPSTGYYSNIDTSPNQGRKQCSSVWERQEKVGLQVENKGRNLGFENGKCGHPLGLPQSQWPPLHVVQNQPQHQNHTSQHHQHNGSGMRAVFLGGSGVRRESAGTGVFLPRRFGTQPESRRKTGCSTVLLPARVVQALNLNLDDMNGHAQSRLNPAGFAVDHEALLAQRSAIISQRRRMLRAEVAMNHEARLPQEWTY